MSRSLSFNERAQDPRPNRSPSGKKRKMIDIACTACQRRKSKCDGGQPACNMCSRKGSDCQYSADLRRNSSLRELNYKLIAEMREHESLTNVLRHGDHSQIAALLRQFGNPNYNSAYLPHDPERRQSPDGTGRVMAPRAVRRRALRKAAASIRMLHHTRNDSSPSLPASTSPPREDTDEQGTARASVGQEHDASMTGPTRLDDSDHASVSQDTTPSWSDVSATSSIQDNATNGVHHTNLAPAQIHSPTVNSPVDSASGGFLVFDPTTMEETLVATSVFLPFSLIQEDPSDLFSIAYTSLYRSFQLSRRERLRQGHSPHTVMGSAPVDARGLLSEQDQLLLSYQCQFPRPVQEVDTVSKFMTDEVKTFGWDDITMLGIMHLRYRMMQWLICPCEETYGRLPSSMLPTPAQMSIAHPLWVDFLVVPSWRNLLVTYPSACQLPWHAHATSIRLTWNKSTSAAVVVDESGRLHPSPDFQEHVKSADAWSLPRSVFDTIPLFDGFVSLREDGPQAVRRFALTT